MDKVAKFPATQSVSRGPHHSLEEKVERMTRELTSLRREVAELKSRGPSEAGAAQMRASGKPLTDSPSWQKKSQQQAEFDWDAWARETKARIRGEIVDKVTASSGNGAV